MFQRKNSSRTDRPPRRRVSRTSRDPASGSRAETVTRDEEAADLFTPSPPRAVEKASGRRAQVPVRAPAQSQPNTRPSRSRTTSFHFGDEHVRIRSPSSGSHTPSENAPSFAKWLRSPDGQNLSPQEAARILEAMTMDELLKERHGGFESTFADQSKTVYSESVYSIPASSPVADQRRAAYTESACSPRTPVPLADQRRTGYSESVYSTQAPPSPYGGHQGQRFPPPGSEASRSRASIEQWFDDLRLSDTESQYGGPSKWGGEREYRRR